MQDAATAVPIRSEASFEFGIKSSKENIRHYEYSLSYRPYEEKTHATKRRQLPADDIHKVIPLVATRVRALMTLISLEFNIQSLPVNLRRFFFRAWRFLSPELLVYLAWEIAGVKNVMKI